MATIIKSPLIKNLGQVAYQETWDAMREFTDSRDEHSQDELWFLEHPPVFTQGMNGKDIHLLMPGEIPVIPIDRGGQVTYHGPGQLVVYPLIDIKRLNIGVRDLVSAIEKAIINTLQDFNLDAYAKPDAPGVYIQERKIASLGLRVRKYCSYHGLALNVDMDLEPFSRINPCGYQGLVMTDMRRELDLAKTPTIEMEIVADKLAIHLNTALAYQSP
jgi:lipoyl(octanoyl) transferase